MSAAKRVAHAAETIRARWERSVESDPQTEAAQALEDTGQLLDPEVAEELDRLRTERDRYRTAWGMARTRAIPIGGAADRYAARAQDAQEALQHMLFTVIASQLARRAAAEEIAELRAERHSTNESLDDAVQELRRRETGPALPWAHAMPDDDLRGFLDDLVSAAMGRWQSSPEVPDREVLAAVEEACAAWRTPGQGYRSDEDEPAGVPPLMVFRASHESTPMGHYDSREAAMDHVHATLAHEEGGDVTARVIWRADDPEADEPVWECWLFDSDMADDKPTGYVVTPLEVASKYDPEADE